MSLSILFQTLHPNPLLGSDLNSVNKPNSKCSKMKILNLEGKKVKRKEREKERERGSSLRLRNSCKKKKKEIWYSVSH